MFQKFLLVSGILILSRRNLWRGNLPMLCVETTYLRSGPHLLIRSLRPCPVGGGLLWPSAPLFLTPLLTSHQVLLCWENTLLPMSMSNRLSARWPVFMILACDGDVRDRFQSVMDGVAVAGGGRPGSAAREGEPEDYTVIPLLFPNPFLPLPTTFVSLLHPAFPRHHPFYVGVSYSPASSSLLFSSFSLSSSLICSSYCFLCFHSFTLYMTFISSFYFFIIVLCNWNICFHSLNYVQ